MARAPRVEFPGAIYHVRARGSARQDIVSGTACWERLENDLALSVVRYGCGITEETGTGPVFDGRAIHSYIVSMPSTACAAITHVTRWQKNDNKVVNSSTPRLRKPSWPRSGSAVLPRFPVR